SLAVEGLVVAGREGVRPEHDPALRLVAEPFVARARVELTDIALGLCSVAVADTVVAGQVRGSFRRGDQVVARQAEIDRARQAAPSAHGASPAATAAVDQPDDPPGTRSGPHEFRVGP